ncbi:MAG: hypothetical protein ACPL3C_00870 [Pyrobaculum sp.]|uniref:hypothetical protein n=1 Tax=Pyrobaculum sp. TaxID=2004705 RepID=UPI003CC26F43
MGKAGCLALCLALLFTVAAGANWKEIELYIPKPHVYDLYHCSDAHAIYMVVPAPPDVSIHIVNLTDVSVRRVGIKGVIPGYVGGVQCATAGDKIYLFTADSVVIYFLRYNAWVKIPYPNRAVTPLDLAVASHQDLLYILREVDGRRVIEIRDPRDFSLVDTIPADGVYAIKSFPDGVLAYGSNNVTVLGQNKTFTTRWFMGAALLKGRLYIVGGADEIETDGIAVKKAPRDDAVALDADGNYLYLAVRRLHPQGSLEEVYVYDAELRHVSTLLPIGYYHFLTKPSPLVKVGNYTALILVGHPQWISRYHYGNYLWIKVFYTTDIASIKPSSLQICKLFTYIGFFELLVNYNNLMQYNGVGIKCIKLANLLPGRYYVDADNSAIVSLFWLPHAVREVVDLKPGEDRFILLYDKSTVYVGLAAALYVALLYWKLRRRVSDISDLLR